MSVVFYQAYFYDQLPEVAIVRTREFHISLQSVECGVPTAMNGGGGLTDFYNIF